jgi:hypothetical protein
MLNVFFGDMLPPLRDDQSKHDYVLVGTAAPVQIEVRTVEHHLTPDNTVCVGTFHEGHTIGRCAIPAEGVKEFLDMSLFDKPVSLALNVRLGGPGVEGSLLALVPMEKTEAGVDEEDEPWRASVSDISFDAQEPTDSDTGPASHLVGVFLGEIVRFDQDRRNPNSLLREAADMLAGVIRGKVSSAVDRVIEELTTPASG